MGIVKLAASGKSVQFVTDEGDVYFAPCVALSRVLAGEVANFITLTRFANKVAINRYPKSNVWGDKLEVADDELTTKNDGFAVKQRKQSESVVKDVNVW